MYQKIPLLILALIAATAAASDDVAERAALVAEVERDVRETSLYTDLESLSPSVTDALNTVPRHRFVPDAQRSRAYENRPLPIGYGQTISQPFIVALMTQLLQPGPDDVVLEVGTGSAYQAAVLAQLVDRVYSIEIVPELGRSAAARLAELGYDNVDTRIGDGYYGWEQQAPFDAIIITAAGGHVPPPLIRQLKPGGRMVAPVGGPFMTQQLMLIEKLEDGGIRSQQLLPVRFVPLTGDH